MAAAQSAHGGLRWLSLVSSTDQCQSSGLSLPVLNRRNTATSSEMPSSSEILLLSSAGNRALC